jgi:zinc protease
LDVREIRTSAVKKGVKAALVALSLTWGSVAPAQAKVFDPTVFTLDNGLQVVVVENHRSPVITQMVWYKVGSADEQPGKSGLAHLLEHLMFKGTPTVKVGEFSKIVARLGGEDNAFTSAHYTAYYQVLAARHLETAMKMEADRMHNLVLADTDVETERAVVEEERRSRTDNSPDAQLEEAMSAALYLNHPYHRPVIGWAHEIAALNRQDALDFYHRWYAPNNAILVVAGDVTPQAVADLAKKWFGDIPRADTPERTRLREPETHGARLVTVKDGRVEQPSFSRLYLAPSAHYGDAQLGSSASAPALEVLAEILGGGSTSRLFRDLVLNGGVAVSVSASYDSTQMDYSTFALSGVPRPGVSLDRLEAAVDKELAKALTQGIGKDEVDRAKDRLTAGTIYARDSVQMGARVLGAALASGLGVDDVEDWPDRIGRVSVEDVNAALARVIQARRSVTGYLLPDPDHPNPRPSAAPMARPQREVR